MNRTVILKICSLLLVMTICLTVTACKNKGGSNTVSGSTVGVHQAPTLKARILQAPKARIPKIPTPKAPIPLFPAPLQNRRAAEQLP